MKYKVLSLITVILIFCILRYSSYGFKSVTLSCNLEAEKSDNFDLFYDQDSIYSFNIDQMIQIPFSEVKPYNDIDFLIPEDTNFLRLDIGNNPAYFKISNPEIGLLFFKYPVDFGVNISSHQIEINVESPSRYSIEAFGEDPQFIINVSDQMQELRKIILVINTVIFLAISIVLSFILIKSVHYLPVFLNLARELYANRSIIFRLAYTDFKKKYTGSYLGIIWAFIQPVVTILVYWFVFQVGLKATPISEFPFVLWLMSGMIPWFFFTEAVSNASSCFMEYSYLVKKVVFKISLLPIAKIISSLFVHLFFVCFLVIIYIAYGYPPTIYWLQLFYYLACTSMLVLAISYISSSIVVFSTDVLQIITIMLQIGMWATPIMWNISTLPLSIVWIFKLNPMFYIVQGYRDSLIDHVWFWERYGNTTYFWFIIAILLLFGGNVFRKLKIHFADVL